VKNRIKKRDRWTCRVCGQKFVDLYVEPIVYPPKSDDDLITLCETCKIDCSNNEYSSSFLVSLVRRNKVVLLGDCHNNFSKLDSILTREEPFNFFLSVGDVGTLHSTTLQDVDIIDKWKNKGYFVRGNHDDIDFFSQLSIQQDICGLSVSGLNGMLKTRTFLRDTSSNISFKEILYLSHLKNIDILVTHQPPIGLFNNTGEYVFNELLGYLVPKLYVCGHIHAYKLRFFLNTFVISLPMVNKGYGVAYFQGKDLVNLEIILKKGRKTIRI